MKILWSQRIQAYPSKTYSSENLTEIEWEIKNISTSESLVLKDIKYYEYKNGSVSFKIKAHDKNVKIKEIISKDDE